MGVTPSAEKQTVERSCGAPKHLLPKSQLYCQLARPMAFADVLYDQGCAPSLARPFSKSSHSRRSWPMLLPLSSPQRRTPRLQLIAWLAIVAALTVGCTRDSHSVREAVTGADTDSTKEPIPTYRYPTVSGTSDAPYVTTPEAIVDSMLALAGVTADDVIYDLGSGDGRIPIRAATKYGARGVGIEIEPDLVEKARQNAQKAGVADQVAFRQGDLFEADITGATVVTLYLLPSINLAVRPKLFRELRSGARVVSYDFHMEEWKPNRVKEVGGKRLYLWRMPEEVPSFVREREEHK